MKLQHTRQSRQWSCGIGELESCRAGGCGLKTLRIWTRSNTYGPDQKIRLTRNLIQQQYMNYRPVSKKIGIHFRLSFYKNSQKVLKREWKKWWKLMPDIRHIGVYGKNLKYLNISICTVLWARQNCHDFKGRDFLNISYGVSHTNF